MEFGACGEAVVEQAAGLEPGGPSGKAWSKSGAGVSDFWLALVPED